MNIVDKRFSKSAENGNASLSRHEEKMQTETNPDVIAAKLKALLFQEVGISETSLLAEDLILVGEDSGIDSVGVLRLVMAVEREFGIVIGDTDINPDNFQTLSGLVCMIARKLV